MTPEPLPRDPLNTNEAASNVSALQILSHAVVHDSANHSSLLVNDVVPHDEDPDGSVYSDPGYAVGNEIGVRVQISHEVTDLAVDTLPTEPPRVEMHSTEPPIVEMHSTEQPQVGVHSIEQPGVKIYSTELPGVSSEDVHLQRDDSFEVGLSLHTEENVELPIDDMNRSDFEFNPLDIIVENSRINEDLPQTVLEKDHGSMSAPGSPDDAAETVIIPTNSSIDQNSTSEVQAEIVFDTPNSEALVYDGSVAKENFTDADLSLLDVEISSDLASSPVPMDTIYTMDMGSGDNIESSTISIVPLSHESIAPTDGWTIDAVHTLEEMIEQPAITTVDALPETNLIESFFVPVFMLVLPIFLIYFARSFFPGRKLVHQCCCGPVLQPGKVTHLSKPVSQPPDLSYVMEQIKGISKDLNQIHHAREEVEGELVESFSQILQALRQRIEMDSPVPSPSLS